MRRKDSPRSWPSEHDAGVRAGDRAPRTLRLAAGATALGVTALTAFFLPSSTFTTRAIVEIGTQDPAMRLALAQASHEAVLAQPVLARAAASLVDMKVTVPDPELAERFAVMTGMAGSHATGREARLANALLSTVTAGPGQFPGTIDVVAAADVPETAAKIANAVADAFVGDAQDSAADVRRERDSARDTKVAALKAAAAQARARFTALGGVSVDPAQARATAAAATAVAQARVDVIRVILASGSPPLSDRRDVPEPIAAAQRTYLDLTGQLAKAHETLGDRHTTVISLRDGVARAAAELTAAWRRLDRAAHADLEAARQREADLRKTTTPTDATRRGEIEAARIALQTADQAVTAAEAARRDAGDPAHDYRLIALAPIPALASGFSILSRAALALAAGLATLGIFVGATAARRRLSASVPAVQSTVVATPAVQPARASFFEPDPVPVIHDLPSVRARDERPVAVRSMRDAEPSRRFQKAEASSFDADPPAARRSALAVAREPVRSGLRDVVREMLHRIETIDPQHGVPTVMVGANDPNAGTAPVALALAIAATAAGRRVLMLESQTIAASLAGAAILDAEPMLADVFGTLRVVLDAEAGEGLLSVAPYFEQGARLAATLARQGDTPLIDDVADAFDLVIVDGGERVDDIPADLYLRAGRFTSRRDDERYLALADASTDAFLGTMVGGVFLPWTEAVKPSVAPRDSMSDTRRTAAIRPIAVPRQSVERRRTASR